MAYNRRDKTSRNKGVSEAGRGFAYTIAAFSLFVILIVAGGTVGLDRLKGNHYSPDHNEASSDYDYRSDQ